MPMALPSYHHQCTFREDGSSTPSSLLSSLQIHQRGAKRCNITHDTLPRSVRPLLFDHPSPAASLDISSNASSVACVSSSASPSTTPPPPPPPSSSSMPAAPPDKLVLSILGGISPRLSVRDLQAVPSARPQLLYNVELSDGPNLLLALSSPPMMRLLRSERSSIGCEAAILKWLSTLARDKTNLTPSSVSGSHDALGRCSGDLVSDRVASILAGYLPIFVRHETFNIASLALEYCLSRPPRGMALSTSSTPLSLGEQRAVDYQIGQLVRCISSQLSPTRRFGIAADVLSVPPSAISNPSRRPEGSLHATRGADTWTVAFHSLLEAVLRDGEDLSVMISYANIRKHFGRWGYALDAVKEPRLVVIDAGEDGNTLVSRTLRSGSKAISSDHGVKSSHQKSKSPKQAAEKHSSSDQPRGPVCVQNAQDVKDMAVSDPVDKPHIQVTGLRQWTNCIFGDPLIALIFNNHPSREFWSGFEKPLFEEGVALTTSSLIEDEANAHVRLLLYECYHSVVAIVREFYRPQHDSSKRELTARKRLGNVLAKLDELSDEGSSRRRRMSGEMSPAKRPKSDEGDDHDNE